MAISALGAAQHGVFGLDQLIRLGLGARAVQKRSAAGRLHRIHRTVYSLVAQELLKREGLWLAAVLACGDGAVLSHRSAAALHGLRHSGGAEIDVTVPGPSRRKQRAIKVHESKTLTETDITIVEDIPCTTAARTKLDLADVVDHRSLERVFDQSEILELFDLKAIEDQLRRNPTRRGAKLVRAVLREHYVGSTPTWNEFEEAMFRMLRAAGLPEPEVNGWITLPDGGPAIRGDFVWRAQRLIVETDGRETHGTRQAFERDRRRDQRALVAGWRVIRVTWRQLKYRPREVAATLAALLQL